MGTSAAGPARARPETGPSRSQSPQRPARSPDPVWERVAAALDWKVWGEEHRIPPTVKSARWQLGGMLAARSPDPTDAARLVSLVDSWRRRCIQQDRIARALKRVRHQGWVDVPGEDGRDRVALDWVDLETGPRGRGQLARVHLDGRPVVPAQAVDLSIEYEAVRQCGWGYRAVARVGEDGLSRGGWVPITCGRRVCPHCAHARAVKRRAAALPGWLALAQAGCPIVHVTTTIPVEIDPRAAVVLTDEEADRMDLRHPRYEGEADGAHGRAVSGPTLRAAIERLQQALREAEDGRGYREAHRHEVVGELRAYEATQIHDGRARWHVHVHRLMALRPGIPLTIEVEPGQVRGDGTETPPRAWVTSGRWWDAWCRRWEAVAGAAPEAQRARVVYAGGDSRDWVRQWGRASPQVAAGGLASFGESEIGATIRHKLSEVIKYPGKVSDMTAAGICEFVAATKSLQTVQTRGICYARGRGLWARQLARFERWIDGQGDADPPDAPWEADVPGGGWDAAGLHTQWIERPDGAASLAYWRAIEAEPDDDDDDSGVVSIAIRLRRNGPLRWCTRSVLEARARAGQHLFVGLADRYAVTPAQLRVGTRGTIWARRSAREVLRGLYGRPGQPAEGIWLAPAEPPPD